MYWEGGLPWCVETVSTGARGQQDYWATVAKFADEAAAWEYGARYTRARVSFKGEVVGTRMGGVPGSNAWEAPACSSSSSSYTPGSR